MKIIFFFALFLGTGLSCSQNESGSGSDLKLTTNGNVTLWPKAVVPYVISNDLSASKQQEIKSAVATINEQTNITVIPLNRASEFGVSSQDYIRFVFHEKYCSSYIGRQGGGQEINISNWCKKGSIMHEIFHALGIEHEQLNPNGRVQIMRGHIQTGHENNFSISNPVALTEHDYQSIMHYHSLGFSLCDELDDSKWSTLPSSQLPHPSCRVDGWRSKTAANNDGINCRVQCATLLSEEGDVFESNRTHLTSLDIQGINKLYADATGPKIPTGPVSLMVMFNNGVVHASGSARVGNGKEIYQVANATSDSDQFYLVKADAPHDGYKVVSKKYTTCLAANYDNYAAWLPHFVRYNVYHHDCYFGDDIYWKIEEKNDGYYEFRNTKTNLCIHHSGGHVLTQYRTWQIYQDDCDGSHKNLMRIIEQ